MGSFKDDSEDKWLETNAAQREALRSMLRSLENVELPEAQRTSNYETTKTKSNTFMTKITQWFKKLGILTLMFWIAGSLNVMAQNRDFVPGKVRVKVKPNSVELVAQGLSKTAGKGGLRTGLSSLDKVNAKFAASGMKRVFPFAGKHEAKHKKHGLHLWYEIEVNNEADMQAVAQEYAKNEHIEWSETVRLKSLNYKGAIEAELPSAALPMTTNDPYLTDQWHLVNNGTLPNAVAGADINIVPAWDITAGRSDVIVAVVDGGIDTAHEDLIDNLWVNTLELNGKPGVDDDFNGYIDDIHGFNFTANKGEITAHEHGTHVAGTVAAVSNNGKGVAGVAGGTGNGDGIRMISAQVFADNGTGNFAAAIVYGADNGAVISQNSWGYQTAGNYEQAVLDAINYFIEEAGNYPGSPMRGGVVLFAAGNNGTDQMHYPGFYDKTIAVASTGANYKRAYYSNYGTWVDLATTGGNLRDGSKSGVLSTLPGNRYGYLQGTSMATPHASGVAALIVSRYGSSTFTAETLKKRLLTGVRDINVHNPGFEGKLGSGFMDAYLALAPNDMRAPEAISDLTLLGTSEDFASLSFSVPADNGDQQPLEYHLYWSKDAGLGAKSKMTIPNNFRTPGTSIEVTVEDLEFETTYYFAVEAVDRWGNVSALSNVVAATTNRGPDIATNVTSLNYTIDVRNGATATGAFSILNNDEGILNWEAETREVSNLASFTGIELPMMGTRKTLAQLKVQKELVNELEKFKASEQVLSDWAASDKKYFQVSPTYVIGELDTTMTNSSATKFVVNEEEGFNLTQVAAYLNLDKEDGPAIMEIYRGENIHKDNLIYVDNRFAGTKENDSRNFTLNLTEQLFFEKGETFWIVIHAPSGNLYPLGIGPETSPELSDNCFMSFDLGESWVPMAGAIEDDRWVWKVQASSKIAPLHQYFTLDPVSGKILGVGQQEVSTTIDGSQLINGTYKSNIVITSNDADTPMHRVAAQVVVSGQAPALTTTSILDFGSVFNGLSSTKEMTVINTGLGRFRTKTITSSNPAFVVTTSVGSLNVAAKSESTMAIKFTPSGVGNQNAVITLTSYNGDVHKFNVFGVGTEPAQLTAAPTSFDFGDVMVGDALQANITLTNTGQYPLQYGFPAFTNELSHIENLPSTVQRFPYVKEKMAYGTYVFQDITAQGVDVTEYFRSNSSNEFLNVELGFDFPFFGKTVNSLYVTKRGILTLGTDGNFNSTSFFHGTSMPNGYIAALLREWAVAKGGSIHYKRELGKFIVQYTNVRHANDKDNVAITFQIELYGNGDIKFIYDKIDGVTASTMNTFFSAVENEAKNDGVLVNSNSDKVYLPMAAKQIVHIHSPGIGLVQSVEPASGMIQPGESKDLLMTINGEKMTEGAHAEYIAVLSNDPFNSSQPFEIKLNVVGGGTSDLILSESAVDFGNVFQQAPVSGVIAARNKGTRQMEISDVTFANAQLTTDVETPVVLKPNETLYISYTLNTQNLGPIADQMVITDLDANTYSVAFTAQIVDAPGIEVTEAGYEVTMETNQTLVEPFVITNTGAATLEYAIAASEHITVEQPATPASVEEFTYVYRSTYDDVMQPSSQWIRLTEEDKVNFRVDQGIIWEEIELPFEFEFYQEKYSKLWMSSQGVVSFDPVDETYSTFVPPMVPNDDHLNNIIAPYFAAGGPNTTKPVEEWGRYYKTFEDKVVFEWRNYNNLFFIGGDFSIQLILYKNGKIKFQYKSDPSQPIRAFYGLIGIENKTGTDGLQLAYYQDYLKNDVAIDIYPAKKETLEPGASRTYDLTISTEGVNAGNYQESVKVINNSPLTPEVVVPVNLTVNGAGELTFNPEIIDLGENMVRPGAAYTAEFSFSNTGVKTMTVQNLRLEDASIAKLEHLVFNVRWGWQWTLVSPSDTFIVEPGFESKTFRLTFNPTTPVAQYTNNVLADTDFSVNEALPITAVFKLPPVFTVNNEAIYHMAYDDQVFSHNLNLGNLEGESPLNYEISLDYHRTEVTPAAAPVQKAVDATLLKQVIDAPSAPVAAMQNMAFAEVLAYENEAAAYTAVGYNGTGTLTTATRFVAPEHGFNLSHVQVWYAPGQWLNSDINVEIRIGDHVEEADVLFRETINYKVDQGDSTGKLIDLELSEVVELLPYEKFHVVLTYPLGAKYPQGVVRVDNYASNRYKFTDGGFWYDIAEAGLRDTGWMVRAAGMTVAEKNWISLSADTNGEIAIGATAAVEVQLLPARADKARNIASLKIATNDPDNKLVSIPVTLDINQAPSMKAESMYYVNEAETLSLTLETVDHEGDALANAELLSSDAKASVRMESDKVIFTYTPDFEDSGAHTFEVALEDQNGIRGVSTIHVEVVDVNRNPDAAAIGTQYINLYTGSYRVDWTNVFSDPDGDVVTYTAAAANTEVVDIFENETSLLVTPRKLGQSAITLKGYDAKGGEVSTTFDVVVIGNVTSDQALDKSWKVHPNPVEEVMNIQMYYPVMEKISIRIYNTLGVLIKTAESAGSDDQVEIPVSDLRPGVYFVELSTANAKSVQQIIKQ